jgi:hypothetical protein
MSPEVSKMGSETTPGNLNPGLLSIIQFTVYCIMLWVVFNVSVEKAGVKM